MTKCTINNCTNKSLAKGMCNAHYLRSKKNKDLNAPLKNFNPSKKCIKCGVKTNGKGNAFLCSNHYKTETRINIKKELIEKLGGKCSMCNGIFPTEVYDFHHLKDKKYSIGNMFLVKSKQEIFKEAEKCILLCANCHRMHHAKQI
jgi:hypothetical protein